MAESSSLISKIDEIIKINEQLVALGMVALAQYQVFKAMADSIQDKAKAIDTQQSAAAAGIGEARRQIDEKREDALLEIHTITASPVMTPDELSRPADPISDSSG